MRCGGEIAAAAVIFIVALASLPSRGDEIALPLEGYFHPGRAMPVRWSTGASEEYTITSAGAVATRIHCNGGASGVGPWLACWPGELQGHWISQAGGGDLPALHPLQESDRLVANVSDDAPAAASIFSGENVIAIRIGLDDLRSCAMAWETLDAIALSEEQVRELSAATQKALYAEGVMLIAAGDVRPDSELPWKRTGGLWTASSGLELPPVFSSDAYAPVDGWTPGRSGEFRRRIFFSGTIYCLVFAAVCLWRSRWMPLAAAVVTLLAIGAFAGAWMAESPISSAGGSVVLGQHLIDRWIYEISPRPAAFRIAAAESIHPIFEDEDQLSEISPVIDCDSSGNPIDISGKLNGNEPLALMSRRWDERPNDKGEETAITTPLRLLVRAGMYGGFWAKAQIPAAAPDTWPGIVLSSSPER